MKHSPLPWTFGIGGIDDRDGNGVADVWSGLLEDGDFIVRACNNYDEMRGLLLTIIEEDEPCSDEWANKHCRNCEDADDVLGCIRDRAEELLAKLEEADAD